MGNPPAFWFAAPNDFSIFLVERNRGGFAFLAAIENDKMLIENRRVAVAMLAIEFERLHRPKLLSRKIVTTQVDSVAHLKRSNDSLAVCRGRGRGGAVLPMHRFAIGF